MRHAQNYTNATVDLEVYNSGGTKVGQQYFTGQNFSEGASKTYTWNWTAPSVLGAYHVTVDVFNANWSTNLYWNGNAAAVNVAASDASQYNFEGGARAGPLRGYAECISILHRKRAEGAA